jgi:hypothetical protein
MKPRAIKNGTAKKMMRGGMAKKPMMMKAGGTPIKGGKVKKMRAGGGNMSSASLRKRVLDDSIARERNLSDMYRDRGTVGDRAFDKEFDRELREYGKDLRLVETYGRDAPNARSFNTRRQKSKSTKLGGVAKKK